MTVSVPTLVDQQGQEHPLPASCVLGRSDDCDLQLSGDKVSRHHARLSLEDDGVYIEDLNSSNGTRVNGTLIVGATRLRANDQVSIDTFLLTLQLPPSDAETQRDGAAGEATVIDSAAPFAPSPGHGPDTDPAEPGDTALPGAWVEGEAADSTQFFSASDPAAPVAGVTAVRHSDLAQLIVLAADGSALEVIELDTGSDAGEQVWEIGRDGACDVVLDDPTVSSRHAQLVHQRGRWRMVNLVSSNGIIVNGERRLSVYLDSGDVVELGGARLRFYPAVGSAVSAGAAKQAGTDAHGRPSGVSASSRPWGLIAAALALVAVAAAVALLLTLG